MPARNLLHPRDEILDKMERIYRYRMTTTSGGNLSIRDEHGDVWITPARVDKGDLRRTDIVCVSGGGQCQGLHPPSSELPFHQAIYSARPDIGGIVHAHPVALVAFSMTRRVPDTRLFPQARFVCGEVGFAPYALPGSKPLADNIAATFAKGFHCVVLENHGVVVGGGSLAQAFQRFEALEFAARTIIRASALGTVRYLTDEQVDQAQRRGGPLRPATPPAASGREKELRRLLCEFVRRGCRQQLLISTEGSFSVRVDQESFLITPSQQDRYELQLDDLVLVRGETCEIGKTPSRASRAHLAIYRRHADVQAIVFAHPVNTNAFSVTSAEFQSRTIPESYLLLRDVSRLPFGVQYHEGSALAESVSLAAPIALLENDGVMIVGTSILDAFDRLEVCELTAEALISSRHLGNVAPMPDAVIEELQKAFFGHE